MGELDLNVWSFVAVGASFIVGGFVKGLLAFGLPLVMVPLLSLAFPLPTAVAIVVIPILVANVLQMGANRGLVDEAKRLWPMILAMTVCLVLSTHLLVELDETVIVLIAGSVVLAFAAIDLFGVTIKVPERHATAYSVLAGTVGGLVGGMTSFFGTPPLMYLHAMHYHKDRFVQAASLVLFAGGVTLTLMLAKLAVLGKEELILSAGGLIPLYVGMRLGQALRAKVDQALFRRLVLIGLLVVGVSMILRAARGH